MKLQRNIYIALFVFMATAVFNVSCTDDRAEELTSIDY